MSKEPEAVAARAKVEELDVTETVNPVIVLDVTTLERALPPSTPERRSLPDELQGMYYHG